MIPRPLRADPRALFAAKSRIVRLPWASARFAPCDGEGKLAVVVPKKAAKLSVVRHLAKRRVSAAMLSRRIPGVEMVVTLTKTGAEARGDQLRAWCQELQERILETTHA